MNEQIKIASVELQNVKRVKAVYLSPSPNGLTVIGGKNAQGKTSVLDAICYALGGEKFRPSALQRDDSMAPASISLTLSNGLIVERKGRNAALKVIDPTGRKGGQKLLDELIEVFALNLSKFMEAKDAEKAKVLLDTLGIGDQLATFDREERKAYDERRAFGVIADQKVKFFREMPEHTDAPEELLSAEDLIRESQAILLRNAERAKARKELTEREQAFIAADLEIERLGKLLLDAQKHAEVTQAAYIEAQSQPITPDESVAEVQAKLSEMEQINAKVRANLDKAKAKDDAETHQAKYLELTAQVEAIRAERLTLLNGAQMPLENLAIGNDDSGTPVLLYNAKPWDCMSGMEQVRVAVAIVRKLKPSCGFVLLDGLESFDSDELAKFAEWLQSEGLQAIATRVGEGDECSIIIEDGMIKGEAGNFESFKETDEQEESEEKW